MAYGATPSESVATSTDRFVWLSKACIIVPAYDAGATLAAVLDDLKRVIPERAAAIIVVDDGSRDDTAEVARRHDVVLIRHPENRGKGAALRTGFRAALERGFEVALTVDADGQHPAEEARQVLFASERAETLVLGVRNLERDGAPKKNRFSNGISNWFLSRFAGRELRDTQCGLRRYPIARTLALELSGRGYDLEAEIVLFSSWSGVEIVEREVLVRYPEDRTTHFHVVRDPWRIIWTVLRAVRVHHLGR